MKVAAYESRFVFGHDISELMSGVQTLKLYGWKPFGTPYPCNSPDNNAYGMMHMVVREMNDAEKGAQK